MDAQRANNKQKRQGLMNNKERALEQQINEFRGYYEFSLKSLITALNDAGISHYSSGCGDKSVTFHIFPAAAYVEEIIHMLSLKRDYKTKSHNGFRDARGRTEYSPAVDFIQYMKRWSLFAEQAMRSEGASNRGVAAARAKLIMNDLIERLSEDKTGPALRTTGFAKLLYLIGQTLHDRAKEEKEHSHHARSHQGNENYYEALNAAQGITGHRESIAS